jgi:hypothetical protein
MSRYRLAPTLAQAAVMQNHCAHARFVWNLAVEQQSHWRPGRTCAPGYLEQCRQLTLARAEHVRRLSRKTAEVWIPKAGWVRFRWSREVPEGVKSYPGNPRPGRTLAHCLRRDTQTHPVTRYGPRGRHRPGCHHLCGALYWRNADRTAAQFRSAVPPSPSSAQAGPGQARLEPPRADKVGHREAASPRSRYTPGLV